MKAAILAAMVVAGLLPSTLRAASVDYMEQADEHFHNLEYDEALKDYQYQRSITPENPNVYNHITNALLYRELHRFGIAQSGAFKKDNKFLDWKKLELSPEFEEELNKYMNYGRHLAESTLEESPTDRWALYFASQNYAFEASYKFFVEKKYFTALRRGNKAHELSKKNIKHHPDFVDGYFVAGVQEYVIGSLPWYVKMIVALGGITGDKELGLEWVRKVAEGGDEARDQARVVLTILLRREEKPMEAAEVMQELIEDFPRNYVYRMELGSVYRDAEKFERSLEVLRTIQAKVEAEEPGFGRMPDQYRERLEKEIEKTEEAINGTTKGQPERAPS